MPHVPGMDLNVSLYHPQAVNPHSAFQLAQNAAMHQQPALPFPGDHFHHNLLQRHQQQLQMISSKLSSRKRQFDVASLLAPDDHNNQESAIKKSCLSPCEDSNEALNQTTILPAGSDVEENIDVEAHDGIENEEETDEEIHREQSPEYYPTSTPVDHHPLKRRRILMTEEEEEERRGNGKFPWQGVLPMHANLPAGFDKSLLERYYGGGAVHHQQQQTHNNQAAQDDVHSTTSHGEESAGRK